MTYKPFIGVPAINFGLEPTVSPLVMFGRNPNLVSGVFQDIWAAGIPVTWLTAASPIRIRAGGDAADDAAGVGARSILLDGLDSNWDVASEVIATAGTLASAATSVSFIRINGATVLDAGTYTGNNIGDVVIETTGGVEMADIRSGVGRTQLGFCSTPRATDVFIQQVRAFVSSNRPANVRLMVRERGDIVVAPFRAFTQVDAFDEIVNEIDVIHSSWQKFDECSDIVFQGFSTMATSSVEVTLDAVLVDK